jgi:hypothetical protein
MATLSATYLDDLGRIRLEVLSPTPNVSYRIERSTNGGVSWQPVRGAQNMGTLSSTIVDDFEYTPNVENRYRLMAPAFFDSFQRSYPVGAVLVTTGASNSYASTPDNAALDIVGDIDLIADFISDTWPPPADATLLAKYADSTNQRSYRLDIMTTGQIRITWSTNGTNNFSMVSTVPVPATIGQRITVRATLDVDNGAAGRTARFYTASNIGGVFVELGSPVIVGTVTSIFSGTATLNVGGRDNGASGRFTGKIFAARVRNGIGGAIVANPSFVTQAPGTTNFVDSAGRTWTVQANASIEEFAPVIGSTWGTADTGQNWNLGTSSSGFSVYVVNGSGVIASDAPNGTIVEMETDPVPGSEDAEITWSAVYPDPKELLDAGVEWGVGLRSSGFGNDVYESNLHLRSAANGYAVQLRITKFVGNVFTSLASVNLGTWERDVPWFVRFRVQGSQLSARAWKQGTAEPSNWSITTSDTSIVAGDRIFARGFKGASLAYRQYFGPIEANLIPQTAEATASITPMQDGVWLKSITYPMFNRELECVDWQELERDSRTAFFDIKGRHEILGIADVGSSATFDLTFISRSKAENRAIVALLTYGGLMLLQPPGDDEDEDCPTAFSGIPEGYVMVGGSTQSRTVYGKPIWLWTVQFTRVAQSDAAGILPTTITWVQLWDLIGPEGTWETVWETWQTWQELWSTTGNPLTFGGIVG